MKKSDFWVISLVVLIIISAATKAGIGLRIALAANAVIVLIDVIHKGWVMYNGRRKKEN